MIEDVLDDFKEGLGDKNPQLKSNIVKLLEEIFTKNNKIHKNGIKLLLPFLKKLFEDGSAEVREKSLCFFGKVKNIYGDKFFGNLLIDLKQPQLAKINSFLDKNSEFSEDSPAKFNLSTGGLNSNTLV